jgi:hypothetical protein
VNFNSSQYSKVLRTPKVLFGMRQNKALLSLLRIIFITNKTQENIHGSHTHSYLFANTYNRRTVYIILRGVNVDRLLYFTVTIDHYCCTLVTRVRYSVHIINLALDYAEIRYFQNFYDEILKKYNIEKIKFKKMF